MVKRYRYEFSRNDSKTRRYKTLIEEPLKYCAISTQLSICAYLLLFIACVFIIYNVIQEHVNVASRRVYMIGRWHVTY